MLFEFIVTAVQSRAYPEFLTGEGRVGGRGIFTIFGTVPVSDMPQKIPIIKLQSDNKIKLKCLNVL